MRMRNKVKRNVKNDFSMIHQFYALLFIFYFLIVVQLLACYHGYMTLEKRKRIGTTSHLVFQREETVKERETKNKFSFRSTISA